MIYKYVDSLINTNTGGYVCDCDSLTQRDIMIYKYVDSLINTGGYVCDYDLIHVGNDTNDTHFNLYVYKKVRRCEPPALDPDMDAVKVWVAPMSGTIKIDSYIQLIEDTSKSRQQSRYANGIRYSAQWNQNNLSYFTNYFVSDSFQELFNGIIYQNDYKIMTLPQQFT
jgi:hypothetical protein